MGQVQHQPVKHQLASSTLIIDLIEVILLYVQLSQEGTQGSFSVDERQVLLPTLLLPQTLHHLQVRYFRV